MTNALEEIRSALEPFAAIAERDIGDDEVDHDMYQIMSAKNAHAPLPRVGHFRAARRALALLDGLLAVDEWRPITDEIVGTVLLMGPGWREPGVGRRDEDGEWYSPVDGSGFTPEPTHFAQYPPFAHIRTLKDRAS